jgi:hypothetical protein
MAAKAGALPLFALLFIMLSAPVFAQGRRPVFVYPADNQKIGTRAPWEFKVQPMPNAEGFSWAVFQNGRKLSERMQRGAKGHEFGIYAGDTNFSYIILEHPITVQVRALISGKWTDPASITVYAHEPQPVRQPVRAAQTPPSAVKPQPVKAGQPQSFGLTDAVLLSLFVSPFPLAYLIVKHRRRAAAKNTQQLNDLHETIVRKVVSQVPDSIAGAMKQPLQRLCSKILSDEVSYQNRRLPLQRIEGLLYWLLYYWLLDRSKQLQISNLLTRGETGEAAFPVSLYRLHADVANSIQNVLYTIRQHSSPDSPVAYGYPFYNCPFKRLALTLYRNWAKVNGYNPESGEEPPKKGKSIHPLDLKDKISTEELIRRFLDGTPFVDFLNTKVPLSIPHRSRFEHTHIVAGTGHGKTQLLQYFILNDLPHVAAGKRSVIVIDSQGDLLKNILSLSSVGAMGDRVVLIDPNEYTPALNLFDLGLNRLKGSHISERERERILNGAIELYKYMFGALLRAETTARQTLIFEYVARLMMVVPFATIDTLLAFIKKPERIREHIPKLDADSRRFFETEFFASKYDANREQLATRLWEVKSKSALAKMFTSWNNKLDLADAMNRGSLILINTAKDLLKDGCEIFGRFFIALIRQATQERALIDQHKRRDTFLYIDEAHEYFDASMGSLFEEARKFNVGVVIAHQSLSQFDHELLGTVMANTTVKLAGGLSGQDARRLADDMRCDSEFLLRMQKSQTESEFACFVKNATNSAIALTVPFFKMENEPQMTSVGRERLIELNRDHYGTPQLSPEAIASIASLKFVRDQHLPDKSKDDGSPLGKPELL